MKRLVEIPMKRISVVDWLHTETQTSTASTIQTYEPTEYDRGWNDCVDFMEAQGDQAKLFNGYECFHCGSHSVYWGADFDFEDYGLEGEGIVHTCHCANCGADIEYYVKLGEEND